MYLRAKFQFPSIYLTSFRQGVILPPIPKRTFKKPTLIRVEVFQICLGQAIVYNGCILYSVACFCYESWFALTIANDPCELFWYHHF